MPTTHNTVHVQSKDYATTKHTDASYEIDTPSRLLHITCTDNEGKAIEHIYNSTQWDIVSIVWDHNPNKPAPF